MSLSIRNRSLRKRPNRLHRKDVIPTESSSREDNPMHSYTAARSLNASGCAYPHRAETGACPPAPAGSAWEPLYFRINKCKSCVLTITFTFDPHTAPSKCESLAARRGGGAEGPPPPPCSLLVRLHTGRAVGRWSLERSGNATTSSKRRLC
ncbi:hypothetical protein EVAR_39777_1 [Eumeta japonica]|uniref:Uncharacterized protein n=1 Tax=Eumeta variegata TaxID=151549 RepID=A0A4C1X2W9_EUMVA|nr:hypothetical protein EVAR_39777_1 [Eumeta japonica]